MCPDDTRQRALIGDRQGAITELCSPLRIVSPGERIEAGWWDNAAQTRDYFVAQAKDKSCYWVFRERLNADDGDAERWYLHGLFG